MIHKPISKIGHPAAKTVRFKIYPEGRKGKLWFEVIIYPTQRMVDEHRKREELFMGTTPQGGVWAFVRNRLPTIQTDRIGEIVFSRDACGDATVSHEMLHAAVWYLTQQGVDPAVMTAWGSDTHERLADVLECLVYRFWFGFTKAGLKRVHCQGFEGRR